MTTDPKWLEILSESYTQEVSESARNLQEEADQIYTLIETIETALDVDLTESQVDALISALSESQRTGRVFRSALRRGLPELNPGAGHGQRLGQRPPVSPLWGSRDPKVTAAFARHNHDEIRRGPRILKRAERMADEVLARAAAADKEITDEEDNRITFMNQKIPPRDANYWKARQRQHDEMEPVNVDANAGARRRAVAASTLDPELALERGHNRLKLVGDIVSDLKGEPDSTGQQPSDYSIRPDHWTTRPHPDGRFEKEERKSMPGAIRTPKKNRDRKKD